MARTVSDDPPEQLPHALRSFIAALMVAALGGLAAACDGHRAAGARAAAGPEHGASAPRSEPGRVESVPGVDVGDLIDEERALWVELINELLSPCGDPVSVGVCATAAGECSACRPAAAYLARLLVEGYGRAEIEEAYARRFDPAAVVEIELGDSPVRGPSTAPVTLVEFSDFQCPFCGRAQPMLERLRDELPGQTRLVFKHYPLPGHARAMPAARAAEAARLQGEFWPMHDLLFEHQRLLADEDLRRYAERLELDPARFERDRESTRVQQRIEADIALGRELGVDHTPTFFVNGRLFRGRLPNLPAYVREEVQM